LLKVTKDTAKAYVRQVAQSLR